MNEVIGVVGAGTMGNGIAQVSARAGYDVILQDVRDEFIERGLAAINKSLQRDVDKERISADEKQRIVGRVRSTTDFSLFGEATFVVEAVTEKRGAAPLQECQEELLLINKLYKSSVRKEFDAGDSQ